MKNDMYNHFHGLKAAELVPQEQKLVVLRSDANLQEAVKTLSDAHILAAPVVSAKTKEVLGMLSMLDIVTYVVLAAPNESELHNVKSLEIAGRAMTLFTVDHIVNKSGRDPLLPLSATVPSTFVVSLFSEGIHRCVLQKSESETEIVKTISQTDVAKELSAHIHMGKLKHIGQKTLQELGLGQVGPITVQQDGSVLDALKLIAGQRILAVAVTDKDGKIVGNFSASDLKGLYLEKLPNFEESVADFLKHFSPKSLTPFKLNIKGLTLSQLVHHLVSGTDHVMHRVWLVDDEDKVVGVVSLTDIMKLIVDYTDF